MQRPPPSMVIDPRDPRGWIAEARRRTWLSPMAALLVQILAVRPGLSVRGLRVAARLVRGPCSNEHIDDAMLLLVELRCLHRTIGPRRIHRCAIDTGGLLPEISTHITDESREAVAVMIT